MGSWPRHQPYIALYRHYRGSAVLCFDSLQLQGWGAVYCQHAHVVMKDSMLKSL